MSAAKLQEYKVEIVNAQGRRVGLFDVVGLNHYVASRRAIHAFLRDRNPNHSEGDNYPLPDDYGVNVISVRDL